MDDEMLMEEMLNNTGWTSTRALHTDALDMFLLMYGSTARTHRHLQLEHLVHLVVLVAQDTFAW